MKKGILFLAWTMLYLPLAFAESDLSQSQVNTLAINTLAEHNILPIKNIEVISVKAVQWPDSSLGCPQPGMMYAQVITSGYQVTLIATTSGNTHAVHIGAGRAVVCDKTASTRSQTEKNLRFGKRWQQSQKAQQLLADRLSVTIKEIRIVGARTIAQEKAGPLCKKKSGKEKPAQSQLQIIELSHDDQIYRYGVIDNHVVVCDQ